MLLGADLPDDIPIPESRPDAVPAPESGNHIEDNTPSAKPHQAEPAEKTETYVPPPIEKEDPALLKSCLAELKNMGVEYTEIPRIDDGDGCGLDHPLAVASVGGHITLAPKGVLRCQAALALARWTADVVVPMLKAARPDETLIGLDQASTYVCRKRNGADTGKISEHAHGNAIDIAGLRFKGGTALSIKPRLQDSTMEGALQRAITAAACLYFTTVLDPSSDKAHETHLHLDVIQRKSSYRYCW